jgi:hypothetical protein
LGDKASMSNYRLFPRVHRWVSVSRSVVGHWLPTCAGSSHWFGGDVSGGIWSEACVDRKRWVFDMTNGGIIT